MDPDVVLEIILDNLINLNKAHSKKWTKEEVADTKEETVNNLRYLADW
jgi:hypothetical protein